MPPTPPRQRLPAATRRLQIAEAALHLIATTGVQRLTALELARAVGVSDAGLFRHFAGMEAIVTAAIDLFETRLEQSLHVAQAAVAPLPQLHAFFVHRLGLVRRHPDVLQLAFNDRLVQAASPAEAQRVRAIVGWSRAFIRSCLVRAQARGDVRADLPADVLVWTVTGVMRGAALTPPSVLTDALGPQGAEPETAWRALLALLGADVQPEAAA